MGRLAVPVYGGGLRRSLRPSSRPPATSTESSDVMPDTTHSRSPSTVPNETPSNTLIDPRPCNDESANNIAIDACVLPRPPAASSESSDAIPRDTPRNPTMAPRSRADESPKAIDMDACTGLSGFSPNVADVNSIPSNCTGKSRSCLGMGGCCLGWPCPQGPETLRPTGPRPSVYNIQQTFIYYSAHKYPLPNVLPILFLDKAGVIATVASRVLLK
ncbi:hypothetical protein ARMSODRAFT_973547 [Armillaria solidipes]|uniref:Uncharacterized protein n=1 Tax=Armillaria solidipes TaxID=1076256 RepID=A0A2H3BYG2_9AGAR|nr:hypothetical protein ARMSODRAFT_973547 [Armillaria solidipes]